jgi:hypothetical protein
MRVELKIPFGKGGHIKRKWLKEFLEYNVECNDHIFVDMNLKEVEWFITELILAAGVRRKK